MKLWRRIKAWWKRNEYRGPDGDPSFHPQSHGGGAADGGVGGFGGGAGWG